MEQKDIPQKLVSILNNYSPKWFVNYNNELIIEPKNNIYFILEDIKNELEIKCKVIAWLSRPSCKGISNYWSKRIRNIFNEYLGTNFTKEEIELIYTRLENDCNRNKTIEFINSNYDLNILTAKEEIK